MKCRNMRKCLPLVIFLAVLFSKCSVADGTNSLYDFNADHLSGTAWAPSDPTNTFTVIEVMAAVPPVRIPFSFFAPTNAATLWFRMQGLGYQNKGYVGCEQTGSTVWLNNTNCVYDYPGNKLNGMGGPLAVLSFTMPGLSFVTNAWNTLDFWYTSTDNVSTGYRVLEMRVLDASGQAIETVADAFDPVIGETLGYYVSDRKGTILPFWLDANADTYPYLLDADGYPYPTMVDGPFSPGFAHDEFGAPMDNVLARNGDPVPVLYDADGNPHNVLLGFDGHPVSQVYNMYGWLGGVYADVDDSNVEQGFGGTDTMGLIPLSSDPLCLFNAPLFCQFVLDGYGNYTRTLDTNGIPLPDPRDSGGNSIPYIVDGRGYREVARAEDRNYVLNVAVDANKRSLPALMNSDWTPREYLSGSYSATYPFEGIGMYTKPLSAVSRPILYYSDPSSYSSNDIAAGKWLWTNATLNAYWGGPAVNAKCADCHTTDGSDLKFFGYSDFSIFERAKFHGLSPVQARQVVAWIRNSSEPTVGTPWDPPYQPGPGQSSRSYVEWAAGAGLKWVLPDDSKTWNYLFPSSNVVVSFTNTIDIRELPIATPLPVWNEWLPTTSPKDTYPTNTYLPAMFGSIAGALSSTNPATVRNYLADAASEYANFSGHEPNSPSVTDIGVSTAYQARFQGVARLATVRLWEVMHTHRMEGQAASMFPFPVNPHSWQLNWIFTSAPHFTLPKTGHMLGDGTELTWGIRSHQWYWLQMVLNDANHRRSGAGPIDFPYLLAFTKEGSQHGADSVSQIYTALIKSGESATGDTYTRDNAFFGWAVTRTEFLDYSPDGGVPKEWVNHTGAGRDTLLNAFITEYDRMVRTLGTNYFVTLGDGCGCSELVYTGVETDTSPVPTGAPPWNRQWATTMTNMEVDGVSSTVMDKMKSLAEFLWGYADWSRF